MFREPSVCQSREKTVSVLLNENYAKATMGVSGMKRY
jgi:hypothetical protein